MPAKSYLGVRLPGGTVLILIASTSALHVAHGQLLRSITIVWRAQWLSLHSMRSSVSLI